MDTACKTGIDAAKTTSKIVVQKITKGRGDSIGNKIPDKIKSWQQVKQKLKKKKMKQIKDKKLPYHQKKDSK